MKKINIVFLIIFFSFFLININVVYFGDDYHFLLFRDLDFLDYFSKVAEHYVSDTGRFIVCILITVFLKAPFFIWQVLNSFMLAAICLLISKLAVKDEEEKQPLIMALVFLMIAFLNISLTRESVYWLTGSFTYIYPLLMFLAYWVCVRRIDEKKMYFVLAIILRNFCKCFC